MAEVNEAKLLKAVKGGATHSEAAEALGLTLGQLPMLTYCRAVVEAGQESSIPSTAASIKKARDKDKNRWEMIAARAGISVAKVKDLYGGEDAAKDSYIGRGRNFNGADEPKGKSKASAKNKGRAAASKAKAKPAARKGGKAKTLAERQRRTGNPS